VTHAHPAPTTPSSPTGSTATAGGQAADAGRPLGVLLAEVTRRDLRTDTDVVESRHLGHAVITDVDGEVEAAIGDPDLTTFVRSAAKPFQATACLELLDLAGGAPTPMEVAVAWASHRGETRHVDAVRRLLRRSATPPDRLTCPVDRPEADPAATPARLWHNCSGKHALFALAGMHQGTTRDHLLDPAGPLQRVVLHLLEEVFGPLSAVGTDGCGAPAIAAPLATLARAYASLAVDDRWERVRTAGLTHPELVGGEGRLESALLAAGVVAKVGAEGVFAAGWVDEAGRAHGMAVKATDGAGRGVAALLHRTLLELGVIPRGIWAPPPPLGGGRPAGEVLARPEAVDALVHGLRDGR
jgi:L-asparaginase II